ncbi:MAG: hypothetical protein DHS20C10_14530 [marine bacterium B5-7]|nr:MAG: hypothetical protein DHS20C10_14530 [marine bacterium B5-7]
MSASFQRLFLQYLEKNNLEAAQSLITDNHFKPNEETLLTLLEKAKTKVIYYSHEPSDYRPLALALRGASPAYEPLAKVLDDFSGQRHLLEDFFKIIAYKKFDLSQCLDCIIAYGYLLNPSCENDYLAVLVSALKNTEIKLRDLPGRDAEASSRFFRFLEDDQKSHYCLAPTTPREPGKILKALLSSGVLEHEDCCYFVDNIQPYIQGRLDLFPDLAQKYHELVNQLEAVRDSLPRCSM